MIPQQRQKDAPQLKNVLLRAHLILALALALWAWISLGLFHWFLVPFLLGSLTGWVEGVALIILIWWLRWGRKGKRP